MYDISYICIYVQSQLRRNVNKLKDIMKLYYQRKEGHDLDLSLLLGRGGKKDTSISTLAINYTFFDEYIKNVH